MGQNASATLPGQSIPTGESSPKRLEPPDEPPEKKRSFRDDCGMITEGRIFTRYFIDNQGEPGRSEVLVSYHKESQSICWSSPDTIRYDPLHSMKIKDISKVLQGKQTMALQTSLAETAQSDLCFSIVSTKLQKSIDLEANEPATALAFANAVDRVMEHSKIVTTPSRTRWSLPSPPYQMPITQASLSRTLNASLIQHNAKIMKLRERNMNKNGVKKSRSKKGRSSQVKGKSSNSAVRGIKPKVGKKRKQKSSPVMTAQTHVALADLPR